MNDLTNPENVLRDAGGSTDQAPRTRPSLVPIDPSTLQFCPVPERKWIVQDWLGVGYVTGQYGDGGVGKGMTAQALQTATATGTPWLGRAVTECSSIGLYCEDDPDELHRRQDRICQALDIPLSDLGNMRWISGVGDDNTFVTFSPDGRMTVTERFYEFMALAREHRANLAILDNVADLYGGDENNRNQVRRFINVLNRFGLDLDAGVLLNCHPSRAGIHTGNLDGGSTAWNNSMRSRWTLAKAKDEDGADDGERILARAKANYAPDGGSIRLRWASGVLVPVDAAGNLSGTMMRAAAEDTFLALLDRCDAQNVPVSESRNAGNFAPRVFAKRPDRDGYTKADFEKAMHALFSARRITVIEYQRNRQTFRRIGREAIR